jgi:molecular chaperone DnaK
MKSRLESAVERARKAHRGEDMGEIRSALEELTTAYQEAGRSLYAQSEAQTPQDQGQPAGEPAGAGAQKEDVVEADYEIVDENKKA